MTRPLTGTANTVESWRYRVFSSPEWRQLMADYQQHLAERAIACGFDSAAIAELGRDLRGVQAFVRWCENSLAKAGREGRIDGRAYRFRPRPSREGEAGAEPESSVGNGGTG